MKIILNLGLLFVALLTFTACDGRSTLKEVDDSNFKAAQKKSTNTTKNVQPLKNISLFSNGKYMVFIFSATSKYDKELAQDMENNTTLSQKLKEFSLYDIPVANKQTYTIKHNKEPLKTSSAMLRDIYGITGTPSLVFLDKNSSSILLVPGYMPPKQFIATLDFINLGLYKGVDRKNGDIYRELKKFYIKNNIPIKK